MVNKVILVGNVGLDPEVRTTESGVKVARVRLATTERIYNRQTNENTELTEWHTITLWRGLADVVDRYVHKGSQLYIEGRLRTREWTDKDNQKRYTTEIVATDMKLLGRRTDAPVAPQVANDYSAQPSYQAPAQPAYQAPVQQPVYQQPAPQPVAAPAVPADSADDLPF
jgi:single-strand DNA-binding protein